MVQFKEKKMSDFYIKNKRGEYLPIDLSHVFGKELSDHLIIVRVGSDEKAATSYDLDMTVDSFSQADFLRSIDNLSIIVTPYQIDVSLLPKEELDNKCIYLQITSGDDILSLENQIRKMYDKLKKAHTTIVVPTPLKVGEYKQVRDILKRCQIRKD